MRTVREGLLRRELPPARVRLRSTPSVIPLGSELFIIASDGSVVYGYATAEDTGGNIKGHTVDLFYNNNSLCRSFGRRNVTIYVLNSW